jgi:hypothetical protein
VFELPGGKGKAYLGAFEYWESIFDRDGKSNDYLKVYDEIAKNTWIRTRMSG